jgi:sugar phosphate isomerase/epimerase
MKRREFMGARAAAVTALHATNVRASTLLPCINQVTTLGAAFDAECSAYHDAGFRHVELEGHFALAEALGVPRFVIFDYVDATPKRDDLAMAAERLVSVANLAAKYGVRIALEFIARSRLIGSLPTALQVIRQAAQPNVGLCLDTFHLYAGVSKLEDLDELRPGEVEHVHFHDVPRAVPRELLVDADRIPPGMGVIPLTKVVDALKRIGYAGALSVELFDPVVQKSDPAVTAQTCYAAVTRFTSTS